MKKHIIKFVSKPKIRILFIKFFYKLIIFSYKKLSVLATYNEKKSHEKQDFLKYENFFIGKLTNSKKVLDVGCSYGELTNALTKVYPNVHICGIEIEKYKVVEARRRYPTANFLHYDIFDVDLENYDTVVMSNVFEHIEDRVKLIKLFNQAGVSKILIRVPAYDRDWLIPFFDRYELDYRLDETHFVEFTEDQLKEELKIGGYVPRSIFMKWGEYYAEFNRS